MNNYKKQPFIPAIQKTSTLVLLSIISIVCFLISFNTKTIDISLSYVEKVEAAHLMEKAMKVLKESRMEHGVFIDIENDPNETGLVGSPFSLITTDEGDLDAKLTTLDPNISAMLVDLMTQINLQKNDTVAILMTGSMPGANIAALTACKALGIVPITITSIGASQWGANQVDFTWLDMEAILFNNDLIPSRSIAASIGGRNDMGRLLSPAGRKIITDNILFHGLPIIHKNKLAKNISKRMETFDSILPLKKYKAVINVGGGVASLGTSFNLKLLPPGVVSRSNISDIGRLGGIEGVFSKFVKANVPGLHILNIKPLTEQFKMPFAPIPLPEIGSGHLYANERYNLIIAAICLLIVGGSVFAVGLQSKIKIKEHLIKHEPDSLL
ncbi:MAG: poly-gamma-glutamate system protein [Candidatus Marinimicrobia bacterium]|nr:poly-gamma-glutamate system protein [Candidatus Neomarinimicrobiota bacterium]MBT3502493.1 poly-gamma-glutamate system protein [Candidatus Neomarinimicrobiota bacterium]MBT3839094.1 poly-gamma-glutamate system protein [Candidatus Neomarinimicrobiota bacterium]MBT3999843.1 poly-gamma-glutamate system protein [Candidatus Neomarinimicrobiota bacterium]MBT4283562.1 poly-gamma-glutamate system protein [Candidatus Neomarinimicrobiota bacterium]